MPDNVTHNAEIDAVALRQWAEAQGPEHPLGSTVIVLLDKIAQAWAEGYDVGWNDAEYPGHLARPNPYETRVSPPEAGQA